MFTHKYQPHPRVVSGFLIALGAITMVIGSQVQMEAQLVHQLNGQGSFLAAPLYSSALPTTEGSSAGVLAFGMLMMLLGFGLHALIVLRNVEDRSVTVRAADPQKKKVTPTPTVRKSRKPMEVIWVERTIRF